MQFTFQIIRGRVALILDPQGWQVGSVEAGTFEIDAYLRLSINDWQSLMRTVEAASNALCE